LNLDKKSLYLKIHLTSIADKLLPDNTNQALNLKKELNNTWKLCIK